MKPTQKQLELIKQLIDKHLQIRGINVETTLEFDEEKNKFNLNSTNFQTFPVIHQNLHIINFGGKIIEDEEKNKIVYLPVDVRYEGNGVSIFTLSCKLDDKYNDIYGEQITHSIK